MKTTAFWEMTPCTLVDIYQCFGQYAAAILKAEGAGSTFFQNVGNDPPDCMASHFR
jgi:hypothetical protein